MSWRRALLAARGAGVAGVLSSGGSRGIGPSAGAPGGRRGAEAWTRSYEAAAETSNLAKCTRSLAGSRHR